MARLGYIEWNSDEVADAPDELFADPEVRARFAALIARAAQSIVRQPEADLTPEVPAATGPDDVR